MKEAEMAATNWRRMASSWLSVAALALVAGGCSRHGAGRGSEWRADFSVDKASLADTGTNPYFILEPGYTLHFQHGRSTLQITVLAETEDVDGVKTRVVEEREAKGGEMEEVSRNFFAIDRLTRDVYYFGEDVDIYRQGKVVDHEGAWRSGVKGAKFGLMMPGTPKVGERYYQERAPFVAMDRAEIVSVTEELTTPAGTFRNCVRVRETSKLEGGSGQKVYAPGVGLIRDDGLVLVKVEKPPKPSEPAKGK
jgi:hypothetical protein